MGYQVRITIVVMHEWEPGLFTHNAEPRVVWMVMDVKLAAHGIHTLLQMPRDETAP